MDGTLITAHSDKGGARPTWKMGYGFHPLGAWGINTPECLDMMLRPGNAGSNAFTGYKHVLDRALKQAPAAYRRRVLVRIDGAGASRKLVGHLLALATERKTLLFTCGWTILDADEDAIAALLEDAWQPGLRQDGSIEEDKDVAEITHLMSRAETWPEGLRFIARRVKRSRRHKKNMTAFEKKTDWKYSITCTNLEHTGIPGVPGSQHPQFIDVPQRDHATVETDGVRTAKARGLRNLPLREVQRQRRLAVHRGHGAQPAARRRHPRRAPPRQGPRGYRPPRPDRRPRPHRAPRMRSPHPPPPPGLAPRDRMARPAGRGLQTARRGGLTSPDPVRPRTPQGTQSPTPEISRTSRRTVSGRKNTPAKPPHTRTTHTKSTGGSRLSSAGQTTIAAGPVRHTGKPTAITVNGAHHPGR
jgi:hypothetical protein